MKTHKRLDVWRESMLPVKLTYEVSASFPRAELFGLTSQMRRAAIQCLRTLPKMWPERAPVNTLIF